MFLCFGVCRYQLLQPVYNLNLSCNDIEENREELDNAVSCIVIDGQKSSAQIRTPEGSEKKIEIEVSSKHQTPP